MKRTLLGAGLLCVAFSAATAQSLRGKLTGVESGKIVISLVDVAEGVKADTIALNAVGEFSYSLEAEKASRATIYPVEKQTPGSERRRPPYISVILVPGEQMALNGTFEDYKVDGTAFYKEYYAACMPLDSIDALRNALSVKYSKMGDDEATRNAYLAEYRPLMDASKAYILNYIKAHPDSDVSTALIINLGMRNYDQGLALLTPRAKEGKLSSLYKSGLRTIEKQKEKERRINEMEGKPAPTFTLPGLDGNLISLESLRGKYVVLDFWGSWCGWCIKGIPDMKKSYEKHKGKVEFVSVDCRDTEAKWKKAVADNAMPWVHVRCANGCDLPDQYNVLGYPTKVVIDPQGNVVKTVIGESQEFYELLDKLFAE